MRHFSKRVAGSGLLIVTMSLATSGDGAANGRAAAAETRAPRFVRAAPGERIAGQYIVLLADDMIPGDSVPFVAQDLAGEYGGAVRVTLQNAVRGFTARLTEEQAVRLSEDPRVRLVEENAIAHLSSEQVLPSDNSLWNLDRVDQRTVIGSGDDRYRYCEKASSVVVYTLDTGINKKHTEFLTSSGASRVLNGVKFASDHFVWPGESDDYGTYPCGGWVDNYGGGHGTAVASLIGGKTLGIAKAVRLVPLRVFPCNGPAATVEHLCWGLDWIKSASNPNRDHRPALVNISARVATNDPFASALESVINGLVLDSPGWSGITVVASANNQNTNQACSTPARMAYRNTAFPTPGHVISVGGTNESDARWQCAGAECFYEAKCGGGQIAAASNYGPIVDIWAPAHNLESAHIKCADCRRTDPKQRSGTSFSAAIVSGIVARMLQANPSLTPTQVWSRLQTDATVVAPVIDPSNGNSMLVFRAGSATCSPELP
jgi:subtilisin family serine protease